MTLSRSAKLVIFTSIGLLLDGQYEINSNNKIVLSVEDLNYYLPGMEEYLNLHIPDF